MTSVYTPPPLDRLLTMREVSKVTSLGRSKLYEMIRSKEFPAGIRLSPARRAWRASLINRWIAEREAADAELVA